MTCIVAVTDGKRVVIGGDSAAISGWTIRRAIEPKVSKVAGLVIGYAGSFRMGQLLARRLKEPDGGWKDIVNQLPDEARKILGDAGNKKTKEGQENADGCFLVGWSGRIFEVDSDFQMTEYADFAAIGCGDQIALGYLDAAFSKKNLRNVANGALTSAAKFCGGVAAPFHFVETAFA